jgi:hypothetical protein
MEFAIDGSWFFFHMSSTIDAVSVARGFLSAALRLADWHGTQIERSQTRGHGSKLLLWRNAVVFDSDLSILTATTALQLSLVVLRSSLRI